MSKIVNMPICKKWFDMILSGEKKEEYREIKDYWLKRLMGMSIVTHVKLINGYGKNMPYLLIEVKKVTVGTGKEEWGAVPGEEYYVLELGEIIATGNLIYKPLDKIISIEDIVFVNGSVIKEGTKGEIIDIKKYGPFVRYGVQFENYNDIYIVTQDQFTRVY